MNPLPTLDQPLPVRLYQSEVLDLVGVSESTWSAWRREGKAPDPAYRGKGGNVYRGVDIARFFGILDEREETVKNDPFAKGLQKLDAAQK